MTEKTKIVLEPKRYELSSRNNFIGDILYGATAGRPYRDVIPRNG